MADELAVNGVNGATGKYLLPELTEETVALVAGSERPDADEVLPVTRARRGGAQPSLGRSARGGEEGPTSEDRDLPDVSDRNAITLEFDELDRANLGEVGWAVIFADDAAESVREALKPLLDHRRRQAADRFREFSGPDGHRAGETASRFLRRHGVDPGLAPGPSEVPYYVLIVGDPQRIPYRFQYMLDVDRGVGRVQFDTDEEYARYAESVVAAESGGAEAERTATFFATKNRDDVATRLTADLLVAPLVERLKKRLPEWTVEGVLADDATKGRLQALVGREEKSTFLFSASHGHVLDSEHPDQLRHQGALMCQDWPGPVEHGKNPIPQDFFYAGDDVADDADVRGFIAFFFACFGVGTPRHDDFLSQSLDGATPKVLAPQPFIGKLPQRLLGHPRGGALAVIGHVDRAFPSTFRFSGMAANIQAYVKTVTALLKGRRVGEALEPLNERHAQLAQALVNERESVAAGRAPADPALLATLYLARNDARNYTVFGDPAVRLPVAR